MPRGAYKRNIRPPIDRFWEKVDQDGPISDFRPGLTPCWIWKGKPDQDGYGGFYAEGKDWAAHVWAYLQFVGPIPAGLRLDHLCHTRNCVNPDHLEPVTSGENTNRGIHPWVLLHRAGVCKNGHPHAEFAHRWANGRVKYCEVCREKCSRCGGPNERHTHMWCNACKAAHLREWRSARA